MAISWAVGQLLQREWNLVKFCQKSNWDPSLSGLWTGQHQGQSLMSGGLVRNDRDWPCCATLAWKRARLGLADRPRQLDQREALLAPENKWHGLPHSYTAYDFTISHTIPFLQNTFEESKVEPESKLITKRQSAAWWHDFLDLLFMPLCLASEGP